MQRTRSPLHTGTTPHLTGSSLRVRLSAEGTEVEAAQRRELDSKEKPRTEELDQSCWYASRFP